MLSPHEIIKKVSKLINQGNTCYIHRKNREIITIEPESDHHEPAKMKVDDFIIVPPMPKQTLGFAMKDFIHEVTDRSVEKELINALQRKKPQRNFMQVIESRADIGQHWRRYRAQQCEEYVRQLFIDEYNH